MDKEQIQPVSKNIIHLSNKIRNEISKKFDITLEYEPTLIT